MIAITLQPDKHFRGRVAPEQNKIPNISRYDLDTTQDHHPFYDFVQSVTEEWILFLDHRMILRDDAGEWQENYISRLSEDIQAVVEYQSWLPLLIRKKWLLAKLPSNYRISSLVEFNRLIREEGSAKIIETEWPLISAIRPSAKERYNQVILKRWWDTYNYDYVRRQSQSTASESVHGACIPWRDFRKDAAGYYDVIIIKKIPPEQKTAFLEEISGTPTIYSRKGHSLYLTSSNTSNKRRRQEERNIEQAAWLLHIKAKLAAYGFFIRAIGTNHDCTTYFVFSHGSEIKIRKNKPAGERKKLAILIDMPGIGDAVRLTSLLPEIKKQHPRHKIALIINVKANVIYQKNRNIDEMFICSLRPDPPGFPYIVPNLLSDLLMTRKFDKSISLAWDTTAYFNNEKLNFIDVYTRIAGVSGEIRQSIVTKKVADSKVRNLFKKSNINQARIKVGFQFGASMESKSWSQERSREFIKELLSAAPDLQLINLDFREIKDERVFNLGNQLSIREFISAVKMCDFFIGVDSAGGHIAAALDLPSITIYGKEKPRIGNDHRPLSNKNIGIIPPDDCECPEYAIVCSKPEKCIDSVLPEVAIYALWKSIQLKYYTGAKKIALKIQPEILWENQGNSGEPVVNHHPKAIFTDGSVGLKLDVTDLSGEKLIYDVVFPQEIKIPNRVLGIDVFIEKDVFKMSSYGMMKITLETAEIQETALRASRLHEGWNLLRFPLPVELVSDRLERIYIFLTAQKRLRGNIYIHSIYFTSDKNNQGD